MEQKKFTKSEATCVISEEVIATIACTAALDVPGVAAMAQRPDIRGIMPGNTNLKSVKVSGNESTMVLDVYLTICENFRIPDVAGQVQQEIKNAIQSMTGKPVTRINIHVAGLKIDEESK